MLKAAGVAACLIAVRLIAYALGLRFDASEAPAFWHFIEPELLRTRLAESLYYLHAQPPLFNLWLGVYHKLFGTGLAAAFAASFLALGVLLCVQMFRLAQALRVPGWLAAVGIIVFCTSPPVLLYENFLLYSYPVAVLLTWSAARFYRALETGRERDWFVFSAILAAIVLMRALYHPLWLMLVFAGSALAAYRLHGTARPLVRPALFALLLVVAVIAKNQVVFGHATLSSFTGMNLSRVVLDRMDYQDLSALVDRGVLSSWALTGGFAPLSDYTPAPAGEATGIPVLDRAAKTDGSLNLNHRSYLEISDRLGRDSLAVIRMQPVLYMRSVGENLQQTLHPASTWAPLADARATIAPLVRVYEPAMGWMPGLGDMGVWPVLLPIVLLLGAAGSWRMRRSPDARAFLMAFLVLNTAYVIAVGALMERTENQRFRFDVDPMIWLVLLALVAKGVEQYRQHRMNLHRRSVGRPQPVDKSLLH